MTLCTISMSVVMVLSAPAAGPEPTKTGSGSGAPSSGANDGSRSATASGSAETGAADGGTDANAGGDAPSDDESSKDVTRYQFTGLDIDGELRTPALLQFLARIGGEFETLGIPHRSFMPELQATSSEDAL